MNGGDSTQITFSSTFSGPNTSPGFAANVQTLISLDGTYTVTGGDTISINIACTIASARVLGNCYISNYPECNVYGNVVHEGRLYLVGNLDDGEAEIITPSITVENLTPSKLVISDINGTLDSVEGGTEGQLMTIVGGNPDWKTLDLTSGMTGVLPVANGGTALSAYGTDGQLLTNVNIVSTVTSFSGDGVTLTLNVGAGNGLAKYPIGSSIDLRAFSPSGINASYIVNGGGVSTLTVLATWTSATTLGRVEMMTTAWQTPSIDMGSEVTGILPVANGGTNLDTYGSEGQVLSLGNVGSTALSFVAAGGNVILGVTGGTTVFPVGRQVVLSGFTTTPVSINGPQTINGGGGSTINFASTATSCSVIGAITMVETLWSNPAILVTNTLYAAMPFANSQTIGGVTVMFWGYSLYLDGFSNPFLTWGEELDGANLSIRRGIKNTSTIPMTVSISSTGILYNLSSSVLGVFNFVTTTSSNVVVETVQSFTSIPVGDGEEPGSIPYSITDLEFLIPAGGYLIATVNDFGSVYGQADTFAITTLSPPGKVFY